MKTIMMFAAFALGAAMTQQAVACEWGYHAAAQPATVVVCDSTGCRALTPSTVQQEAASDSGTAAQVTDEPANPVSTTVADSRN